MPKDVRNTRTPEQEAAIDAAVSRLENLLRQRRQLRVGRGTRIDDAIKSAVVGAALCIVVAEPKGALPVRCDRNCRCPECAEAYSNDGSRADPAAGYYPSELARERS